MIRILFLIPGLEDGGAQKQCILLLNELQNRTGLQLGLVTTRDGVHDRLLVEGPHLTRYHANMGSNYDLRVFGFIVRSVRAFKPDVVMSWLHSSDIYVFMARAFARYGWVMTERNSAYPASPIYRLRRFVGRFADAIVSNSAAGDRYWSVVDARKRHVVGNIVPTPPALARDPNANGVVYVGRLEPQKNPVVMTTAFCRLAKRRPDLSFSLVGEGSLRPELEALIAAEGVSDRVGLEGFQGDVDPYYRKARLQVHLSLHEGLPNAVLEGVSRGIPIVASAIPEHMAVMGAEYPYLVADYTDPAACERLMEACLDDPRAAGKLAKAQANAAAMTAPAVADRYLEIFNTVAKRR